MRMVNDYTDIIICVENRIFCVSPGYYFFRINEIDYEPDINMIRIDDLNENIYNKSN